MLFVAARHWDELESREISARCRRLSDKLQRKLFDCMFLEPIWARISLRWHLHGIFKLFLVLGSTYFKHFAGVYIIFMNFAVFFHIMFFCWTKSIASALVSNRIDLMSQLFNVCKIVLLSCYPVFSHLSWGLCKVKVSLWIFLKTLKSLLVPLQLY